MADSSARSSSRSTDLSTPVNDQPSSSSVSKKKAKKTSKSGKKEEDPGNCFCKSKKGGFVILCDGCDRWCHPACVGIPHEIQKALDTSSTYLCPLCVLKKFSKEKAASDSDNTRDDQNAIARLIKEFEAIRKDIDDLKESVRELTNKKNSISEPSEESASTTNATLKSQQRILELHDRELRRNNIVVVGISEDEALNPQSSVEKIFAEKLEENVSVVEARRLGKKSPNNQGPRPILVRLPDYKSKVSLMRKRGKLKGTRIFINDDLTPFQKKNLSTIVQKMKDAKKDGKSAFIARGSLVIEGHKVASTDSLDIL